MTHRGAEASSRCSTTVRPTDFRYAPPIFPWDKGGSGQNLHLFALGGATQDAASARPRTEATAPHNFVTPQTSPVQAQCTPQGAQCSPVQPSARPVQPSASPILMYTFFMILRIACTQFFIFSLCFWMYTGFYFCLFCVLCSCRLQENQTTKMGIS